MFWKMIFKPWLFWGDQSVWHCCISVWYRWENNQDLLGGNDKVTTTASISEVIMWCHAARPTDILRRHPAAAFNIAAAGCCQILMSPLTQQLCSEVKSEDEINFKNTNNRRNSIFCWNTLKLKLKAKRSRTLVYCIHNKNIS